MILTLAQAEFICDMFDEDPDTEIMIEETTGHSGPGLYAWYTDYPDEGSIFIGDGTYEEDDKDDED